MGVHTAMNSAKQSAAGGCETEETNNQPQGAETMILQDFARKPIPRTAPVLYLLKVQDADGEWSDLPERHHERSLAFSVAKKEAASRRCRVQVFRVGHITSCYSITMHGNVAFNPSCR